MIPAVATLMTVYCRETANNLNRSLESIFGQSLRPEEIILIKDGTLSKELDEVIEFWRKRERKLLKVFQLEKNVGLALALNFGLKHCSCEIIARMDSDDISRSDRFEKQLNFLSQNTDIAVVGSWISEFDSEESNIISVRRVPQDHNKLARFAASKNPLNHVTVVFRKTSVLEVGGYEQLDGFEDYLLWIKMLMKGYKIANIPECLVHVRVGKDMIKRRGGWKYILNEINLQKKFLRLGFINYLQFFVNITIRILVRLTPPILRQYIYNLIRQYK